MFISNNKSIILWSFLNFFVSLQRNKLTYISNMDKVVIFARVSTTSQDYERQLNDLRKYANR